MKTISIKSGIIVTAFFTCLSAFSQEVFRNADLAISLLEEGVWVVETTDMTTMYIVEGEEKAILIDTGTKYEDLDKVIARITQKPLWVVATHNHYDHVGNIHYFDEFYLHPADTVIKRDATTNYTGNILFMEEGDIFDLRGRQLKVYLMPGHTPSSILLVDEAAGIAFTSDAFGSGQVWLQLQPHLPMNLYVRTCERMIELMERDGITKLYCGHYPYQKRALGMTYMEQMLTLARKVASGDMDGCVDFGDEKREGYDPKIATNGEAQILFNAAEIN